MEKTTVIITGAVYGPGVKPLPKGEPFETDTADAERLVRLGAAKWPEPETEPEKESAGQPPKAQGDQKPVGGREWVAWLSAKAKKLFGGGEKVAYAEKIAEIAVAIREMESDDLDGTNKEWWTAEGLPRVDRGSELERRLGFEVTADDRRHALELLEEAGNG